MAEQTANGTEAVSFGERLAASQHFSDLFREGMTLVEETASYLDGPGRQESKKLERGASLAYATESMRLTTRLMQLASWLLLHRAVKEGEMSLAQANKEKAKVKLARSEPGQEQNSKIVHARLRLRRVREGEMSLAQANKEKAKVKLAGSEPGEEQNIKIVPERLRLLINR